MPPFISTVLRPCGKASFKTGAKGLITPRFQPLLEIGLAECVLYQN